MSHINWFDDQNKNQNNCQYQNKNLKDKFTDWELENPYTFEIQKSKDHIINETENERVLKKRSRKASSLDLETKKVTNNTRR